MSTLGGRLGLAALRALGDGVAVLDATYLIDTCAADGVALATGCLPEDGRLKVRSDGRHRLELRDPSGRGVAAELTPVALERAVACRRLLDAGDDPDTVLAELRNGPADELVAVTTLEGPVTDA